MDFCLKIALTVTREDLQRVAGAACIEGAPIHNTPLEARPPMVVDSMPAANA